MFPCFLFCTELVYTIAHQRLVDEGYTGKRLPLQRKNMPEDARRRNVEAASAKTARTISRAVGARVTKIAADDRNTTWTKAFELVTSTSHTEARAIIGSVRNGKSNAPNAIALSFTFLCAGRHCCCFRYIHFSNA